MQHKAQFYYISYMYVFNTSIKVLYTNPNIRIYVVTSEVLFLTIMAKIVCCIVLLFY